MSKAAKALSVTPSAISHALSRLREPIDDELFVPGVSGMQPTRRAVELASDIRKTEAFPVPTCGCRNDRYRGAREGWLPE